MTSTDLAALEKRLGKPLPEEYRDFLLANNGGCPTPNEFAESSVRTFLSVGAEYPMDDLETMADDYSDRIPADTLPIGKDELGNLILLAVSGGQRGAVYFWDHELEDSPDGLSQVGDSLTSFLSNLRGK